MTMKPAINLWSSADHAAEYLGRAESVPHRTEGETALLEFIPRSTRRILDLGTGDGRLLALVKGELKERLRDEENSPKIEAVAVDFSPAMLEAAARRFDGDPSVTIKKHNLDYSLPDLGKFDAVVSCFAIHHLTHERKRKLYAEIYARLDPGGVFCNLEHVASPSVALHDEMLVHLGKTPENEDPSNKLLDVETQLQWLREIGFVDVDCHWKWKEFALLAGRISSS
jgi:tRNA (cmo5U34)-methyltransferase